MKKVLITGANSYIGTSFEAYVHEHYAQSIQVDTIDMIDGSWRDASFAGYDSVFHVAGIAHADTGKASEETKAKYYKINCDLVIETAKKAKEEGVHQFIFMSSIIVYGASSKVGETRMITKDTEPKPENFYGDSKLEAEKGIQILNDDTFKVAILRPPMIYGPGSKGNYPLLAKLAQKLPIFPKIDNARSMLFIDNLCEFICLVVKNVDAGIFFPQNKDYVNTSELVQQIAKVHGKTVHLTRLFNPGVKLLGYATQLADKAFGGLVYDREMSRYGCEYSKIDFVNSVFLTEKGI